MTGELPHNDAGIQSADAAATDASTRLSTEASYSHNALVREVQVVGGGLLDGAINGWKDVGNHKLQTALEMGLPVAAFALSAAMPAPIKLAVQALGRTAGTVGMVSLGAQAVEGTYNSASAIADTWNSGDNAARNQALISSQLGGVAFNATVIGALSGVGIWGGRRFFPSSTSSQMEINADTEALMPKLDTQPAVKTALTDAVVPPVPAQATGAMEPGIKAALTDAVVPSVPAEATAAMEPGIKAAVTDAVVPSVPAEATAAMVSGVSAPPAVTMAVRLSELAQTHFDNRGKLVGTLPADVKLLNKKDGSKFLQAGGVTVNRNPYATEISFGDDSRFVQHASGDYSIRLPREVMAPRGAAGEEYYLNQFRLDNVLAQPNTLAHTFLRQGVESGRISIPRGVEAADMKTWRSASSAEDERAQLAGLTAPVAALRSFDHPFFPRSSMERGFLQSVMNGKKPTNPNGITAQDLARLQRQAVEPDGGFLQGSTTEDLGTEFSAFGRVPEAVKPSVFKGFIANFDELAGGKPYISRDDLDAVLGNLRMESALAATSGGRLAEHSRAIKDIMGNSHVEFSRLQQFAASLNKLLDSASWPRAESPFSAVMGGPERLGDVASTVRLKLLRKDSGEVIASVPWKNQPGQSEQTASDLRQIAELKKQFRLPG